MNLLQKMINVQDIQYATLLKLKLIMQSLTWQIKANS